MLGGRPKVRVSYTHSNHFISALCVCVCSLASHVVEVEAYGPSGGTDGSCFSVKTVRNNPAASGVVTGKQTYTSFLSSLLGEESVYWSLSSHRDTFIFPNRCSWQRKGCPLVLTGL